MPTNKSSRSEKNEDYTNIAATLSSAFLNDPYFLYCFGNKLDKRYERLVNLHLHLIKFALWNGCSIHTDKAERAVAIWFTPETVSDLLRNSETPSLILSTVRCFGISGAARLIQSSKKYERKHPTHINHAYLWILGTHQNAQGKGLASKVLSSMLKKCDERHLPAYLESTNSSNIGFYKKHRFHVIRTMVDLGKGCPPITLMWREPQGSAKF